ncbi:fibronectin type III domain-containing protein [Candidatus Poribacteria bacterium]|nr:fibronectin type III domain-containing protein [Candidatus Poribacteria bacterium]
MAYNKTILCIVACSIFFLCSTYTFSQEPETIPPSNVTVVDTPNDDGSSITVTWDAAPEDSGIVGYQIFRNTDGGEFEEVGGQLDANETKYKDTEITKGKEHAYIVRALTETEVSVDSLQTGAVKASGQWFHTGKIQLFIAMIIFCGAILGSIYLSRNNQEVFVRRIPGLEAVDEAIGRATEMGRSILYVLGLGGVSGPATIASMTILGQVARRTADYETPLRVPCNDPIVLNVVREMVKASYLDEGRPDAYSEEDIFFLTDSQFAYAAGVDGMMLREKPAAIFLQGTFYAESLILAETGNSIGAIQIAGTDSEHQLPFLITACDYTLIGEELYAASAYLSKEPMQLGSLRGQDWGKVLIFLTIVFGVFLELIGVNWITTFLQRVG